jgi:hypothetical protein
MMWAAERAWAEQDPELKAHTRRRLRAFGHGL